MAAITSESASAESEEKICGQVKRLQSLLDNLRLDPACTRQTIETISTGISEVKLFKKLLGS